MKHVYNSIVTPPVQGSVQPPVSRCMMNLTDFLNFGWSNPAMRPIHKWYRSLNPTDQRRMSILSGVAILFLIVGLIVVANESGFACIYEECPP